MTNKKSTPQKKTTPKPKPAPKRVRAGRPSTYNFELSKEICDLVAGGLSIINALKKKQNYPSWDAFRKWKNENEELASYYTRCIQDKAEMVDFEIDEIQKDLKAGKITHYVARVLIDTLKWKAAKYYPKMFGDRTQLDHSGKVTTGKKFDFSGCTTEEMLFLKKIMDKNKPKE